MEYSMSFSSSDQKDLLDKGTVECLNDKVSEPEWKLGMFALKDFLHFLIFFLIFQLLELIISNNNPKLIKIQQMKCLILLFNISNL